MHLSQPSWSLQLHKALICFLVLTISACECGPKKGGKVQQESDERVYIMLMHGIGHTYQDDGELKSGLSYLIDPLKKALGAGEPHNVSNKAEQSTKNKTSINVFAPARSNSITAPIKKQAEDMFKFIQGQGVTQKDKLIIIGHSQGGAVAMALYAMYIQDWENIAIISVQGALCGTPAVDVPAIPEPVMSKVTKIIDHLRDDNNLNKLLQNITIQETPVSSLLNSLGMNLNQEIKNNLPQNNQIKGVIEDWLEFKSGPGGTDLSPDGQFIQELKQAIPKPVRIPMLLVAGEVQDFSKCMAEQVLHSTISSSIESYPLLKGLLPAIQAGVIQAVLKDPALSFLISDLGSDWNKLVANGKANDLLIPVSSQLGEGLVEGEKVQGQDKTWVDYVHTSSLLDQPMFGKEVDFMKNFINNKN